MRKSGYIKIDELPGVYISGHDAVVHAVNLKGVKNALSRYVPNGALGGLHMQKLIDLLESHKVNPDEQ